MSTIFQTDEEVRDSYVNVFERGGVVYYGHPWLSRLDAVKSERSQVRRPVYRISVKRRRRRFCADCGAPLPADCGDVTCINYRSIRR